ncbi:MAG: MBG domain-containing protein, partial [Pseudomonadota bacterium]
SLSGTDNGNYSLPSFSGVTSTADINRAILIVTANDQSREQGEENPIFTGTITGFVNNENSSVLQAQPIYSSAADADSSAGNYAITAGNASADNYSFNYVDGTLEITEPAITEEIVTLRNVSEKNPVFEIVYGGNNIGKNVTILGAAPVALTPSKTSTYQPSAPAPQAPVSSNNSVNVKLTSNLEEENNKSVEDNQMDLIAKNETDNNDEAYISEVKERVSSNPNRESNLVKEAILNEVIQKPILANFDKGFI